jgi:hypothetical protein
MSVLTTAPNVKVKLVIGGKEMGDLFGTHAPKSLMEGYRFYCLRKTSEWNTVVFEFSKLHEYEIGTTIRNCSNSVVFSISQVEYESDAEICWLIEWDSYGMHYRIQFYWHSFIEMDT